MLIINVQEGQTVKIGDTGAVTIKNVDMNDFSTEVRMCVDDECNDFVISKGVLVQLMPRVAMVPLNVVETDIRKVSCGFDAPRDINIERLWNTGQKLTAR